MSYATNLESEVIKSQFLAVIKPRKRMLHSTFALYSGSVYRVSHTLGPIIGVSVTGTALSAGSSASLSAGEYWFDTTNEYLYIRKSDSTAPGSSDYIIATYEIYVGTYDEHWYRIPTDNTSSQVYFDPRIVKSPVINQAASDLFFGYYPVKSTSITLANADHFFEGVLAEASFNKISVKMWHLLGDTDTANFRLVFSGTMGTVSYYQDTIDIQILDQSDILDQEYRHTSGTSFFATSDFANLDPKFLGRPIRDVFGVVDGFVPVNVDYVESAPTTSDNRTWVVKKGQSNLGTITASVTTGSTATVTKVTSVDGICVGDTVYFNRVIGTDEYLVVTAVDYGANTVTHAALSGGAMASGDSLVRYFVGRVDILQNGEIYTALYGRDYTAETGLANGTSGFSFSTSLETNLSMPETLSINDTVYCRVYGETNSETLSGSPFGSNDAEKGVLTHAPVILYKLLKTKLGLAESELNLTSFSNLQASVNDTVGFAVPATSTSDFPLYKDLILDILQSIMARLGKDNDDLWTVSEVGPMGSVTKTIEDDEITRASVQYQFDYSDVINHVLVEYAFREVSNRANFSLEGSVSTISASSSLAQYLHARKRQRTVRSLHYDSAYATTLANRYAYALGERRGILTIESKNRFFDTMLGDVIRVSREKIPGYVYSEGTTRTEDFIVIETVKSLNKVTMILDDQKGIEDNSASW